MTTIPTRDGNQIFVNDWGAGKPVLLCPGWPLTADMWESQMLFLAQNGFRAIGYDRRGFGRSSQPWSGYNYDAFADDIADIISYLGLSEVTLVGFSMGGGDVVRYLSRHGSQAISKLALVSSVTPFLMQTKDNPDGVDKAVFEGIRAGLTADRAQFLMDFNTYYFGSNRDGSCVTQGVLTQTLQMAYAASHKATLDCVTAFSETDFSADIAAIDVPTLIVHGDDDQTAPKAVTGDRTAKMITGCIYKIYEGAPHALYVTHKHRLSEDLLAFARS
ncbi:alpha/beta hydrolase [Rhizobium sp. S152]|uniref:alpha/beta fold hydrolase n=1 Tax=Rhizobium sp. S152 TaxID=3055038 RepID=UPI0025A95410|nr:alpha/beta hydrolase [Rhizobium sp. S152]MDM9627577.1 alpha/beta hydrolase [Rhizobium sp. S152]